MGMAFPHCVASLRPNTLSCNFVFNYLICSALQMFSLGWISNINICRWFLAFLTERRYQCPIKCIICSIAIKFIIFSTIKCYFKFYTGVLIIFMKSKAQHVIPAYTEKGIYYYYISYYYCYFSNGSP